MVQQELASSPGTQRSLTFGEMAVGITFNPGGHPKVESIKRKFADIIDELNALRTPKEGETKNVSGDVQRMISVAITEAQTAQMWAVKAVTWQH